MGWKGFLFILALQFQPIQNFVQFLFYCSDVSSRAAPIIKDECSGELKQVGTFQVELTQSVRTSDGELARQRLERPKEDWNWIRCNKNVAFACPFVGRSRRPANYSAQGLLHLRSWTKHTQHRFLPGGMVVGFWVDVWVYQKVPICTPKCFCPFLQTTNSRTAHVSFGKNIEKSSWDISHTHQKKGFWVDVWGGIWFVWYLATKSSKCIYDVLAYVDKVPRGFEPRLLDSESRVLTVTPRDHLKVHHAHS